MSRPGGWKHVGNRRPPFADEPRVGQESVWDYPRPPRVEPDARTVIVRLGSIEIARTRRAHRVLETASPPTFYIPPEDIRVEMLVPAAGSSWCEWKGQATYHDVVLPDRRIGRGAWSYPDPFPGFEAIRGHFSFYPALLKCLVGGERVQPQPGRFYGGWITPEIVGPFKGDAGTNGW